MADDAAMRPGEGDVGEFLNAVQPAAEPTLWGPSIVGCGRLRCTYATGRSGEMPRVGFSPRKAALTLYGITLYGTNADLLGRLGKHKVGKGCLSITHLDDIDLAVLREGIRRGWQGSHGMFEGTHPGVTVESLVGRP